MDTEKPWLSSLSWEQVQGINQSLCKQQSAAYQTNSTFDKVRELWEKAVPRPMTLEQVLDTCRRCYELGPFTFNNGNTFATIGKNLVDDWLVSLPAVEAQIIRNTIGHYIAGVINKRELLKVFRHFQTSWDAYATARQTVPAMRRSEPVPPANPPSGARSTAGLEGAILTPPQ